MGHVHIYIRSMVSMAQPRRMQLGHDAHDRFEAEG